MEKYKNTFYYKIHGELAMFSDPLTRMGGEKYSYRVPTYQAILGITEAIYWHPQIEIIIDEIKIINEVNFETIGTKFWGKDGLSPENLDLSYCTYLKDVMYYVKCHINVIKYDKDTNTVDGKYYNLMNNYIKKGGRNRVFLGCSECMGFVEPLTSEEYINDNGYYKNKNIDNIGHMFYSFDYVSAKELSKANNNVHVPVKVKNKNFKNIIMKNGKITFHD